jgi:hypothetical protein
MNTKVKIRKTRLGSHMAIAAGIINDSLTVLAPVNNT